MKIQLSANKGEQGSCGEVHTSNCLICGRGLEYLSSSVPLTCFYCGKKENGNIVCSSGEPHYVCDNCHNLSSFNAIKEYLSATDKTDPFNMIFDILNNPSIPMLGCHHAYMLTGSILVSLKNRGYSGISNAHIEEAFLRLSKQAAGGYCGLSGVCGIVPAGGIVYSILTGSVCGKNKEQKITMRITALLSKAIYDLTGPSCCKAYLFKSTEILVYSLYADFKFLLIDEDLTIKCKFKDAHPHGCSLEKCPYFTGYDIKIKELEQAYQRETDLLGEPGFIHEGIHLNLDMLGNKIGEDKDEGSGAPAAPC